MHAARSSEEQIRTGDIALESGTLRNYIMEKKSRSSKEHKFWVLEAPTRVVAM
jgi:hypothetical protein